MIKYPHIYNIEVKFSRIYILGFHWKLITYYKFIKLYNNLVKHKIFLKHQLCFLNAQYTL